ncbi:elongation factor G [Aestuariispira ectoiniformans]|uniref:elongation factor G n=1 Tax=Aestuariispira ectoiniformans TaxID=2775080 RepID=UPI00223B3BAE|nr:elongation factor G [Aestuariispira ectoiniformans]
MPGSTITAPRTAVLVGPYLSGKTTLLEAMLHTSGTLHKKGKVQNGDTVGDSAPEARAHTMSVEMNVANADYLGQPWTFIDCPGSVEFANESQNALMVADMAVVVCDPDPDKAMALAPILHFLDDKKIPHLIFINKMDNLGTSPAIREVMDALQSASQRPLVLREVPIRDGDNVTGYVDLTSERAYAYQEGQPSKLISLPDSVKDREEEARQEMLENLADFDDDLLEKLLEDTVPSPDEVYAQFTKDLAEDLIVPVLMGSAEHDYGVRRLLKALRHDCPAPETTAARLGLPQKKTTQAQVFKTLHLPHIGKLSICRVWSGEIKDGDLFDTEKVSGLSYLQGHNMTKVSRAGAGDVVALGRMDSVKTGNLLTQQGIQDATDGWPEPIKPVFAQAISTQKHEDEVRLSTGLAKLVEDDPSVILESNEDTRQLLLWGQGELHLRVTLEKLERQYNVGVTCEPPKVAYKETIRNQTAIHARHKKQTGGHGEFGDVHLDIRPQQRGTGFAFESRVVGGAVPKQYIPAVENGVRDYLGAGPLGFPVVDLSVTLTDGQHHSVDSSDMAFRKAAAQAMREGMPACQPVLLEPIYEVHISVPNAFTSNAQTILSKRRGQILGFLAKDGWPGWDEVSAYLPQSEMQDLIMEIRSQTQGIGWFNWTFAHLMELTGRLADQAVAEQKEVA